MPKAWRRAGDCRGVTEIPNDAVPTLAQISVVGLTIVITFDRDLDTPQAPSELQFGAVWLGTRYVVNAAQTTAANKITLDIEEDQATTDPSGVSFDATFHDFVDDDGVLVPAFHNFPLTAL